MSHSSQSLPYILSQNVRPHQQANMRSTRQVLSTFAAAALTSSVNAAMGPAFSTGPVGSGSWIREATSTLVLPKAPSGSSGDASLWVGMGTSNGDLIQSIADNWRQNDWNIYAYTLLSTSATTQMPIQADGENAQAGDKITMHCRASLNNLSNLPILMTPDRQIRRCYWQLYSDRLSQRPASFHALHQRWLCAGLGQRC
jgi:hypothetical protein